ncbi:MAG: ProQ/FINO family protein [Thiothrix sp.]
MNDATDKPRKTLTITRKPATAGTDTTTPTGGAVRRSGKRIIKREEIPADKLTRPGKAPPKKPASKGKAKRPRQPPKLKKPAPSELRARELSDSLNAFPAWRNRQPLALGIDKQIFRHIAEHQLSASKRVVNKLLHRHTHNRAYLQAIGRGGSRYNLDGTAAGAILPGEQEYSGRVLAAMPQAT